MTNPHTLINKTLKQEFAAKGDQREVNDPLILAKFFNPSGAGTWYAISYDEESHTCFGYVTGLGYDELGYFSVAELEDLRVPPFGLRIERDLFFTSRPLSEIMTKTP